MIRWKSLAAIASIGLLLGGVVMAGPPAAPPPEITAILKKMGSGKPLTPDDQAKLNKWSQSLSGGGANSAAPTNGGLGGGTPAAAANTGGVLHLTAGDNEGGDVCPTAGHTIVAGPVSADAYLAMAKAVRDSFSMKLSVDARRTLFAALHDGAHPVAGGDIAVAMILRGHGSAAVVAAATGAIANPRDPVTANTLSAALRGMKDYKDATIALGYARVLSPKSATLANNLAWLAFAQGDTKFASTMFSAAASNHQPSAQTLLGQGVIALCGKKYAQALPLFRQSLAQQWTDMAAAGVEVSEKGMQQGSQGMGTDIGSPDAYGPKGKTLPGWPDPVLPTSAPAFAADHKSFEAYQNLWVKALANTFNQMKALVPTARTESITDVTANTVTYTFGYEREIFELNDINKMIAARDEGPGGAYLKQETDLRMADGPMQSGGYGEPAANCVAARVRFNGNHTNFVSFYVPRRIAFNKMLADLWGFSEPIIASIPDKATNAMQQAGLNHTVAALQGADLAMLMDWASEGQAAYMFDSGDCAFRPGPPRPMGVLRNYPIDPLACKTPEIHMNFGIVNLNGDCAHLVLSFGELLQGSLDYKFGKDWGDDQLTVWAGAQIGTKGQITNGAITGSASAGVYMTVGTNGALLDAGVQASGSVTGGLPHATGPDIGKVESGQSGGNEQLGVTAKISLIDGPPNPLNGGKVADTGDGTLTSSYGFTFGGNATGSARDEIHNAQ